MSGLSCGMRDLWFSLQYARSLVVTCKLLVAARGIKFPDQELNSRPLHWECGVLAIGPPRKSLVPLFQYLFISLLIGGSADEESTCSAGGFDPWVGKIPWRRERLPTSVFWPGIFHGLYSPWGSQRVGHDWGNFTFSGIESPSHLGGNLHLHVTRQTLLTFMMLFLPWEGL